MDARDRGCIYGQPTPILNGWQQVQHSACGVTPAENSPCRLLQPSHPHHAGSYIQPYRPAHLARNAGGAQVLEAQHGQCLGPGAHAPRCLHAAPEAAHMHHAGQPQAGPQLRHEAGVAASFGQHQALQHPEDAHQPDAVLGALE